MKQHGLLFDIAGTLGQEGEQVKKGWQGEQRPDYELVDLIHDFQCYLSLQMLF